jgi:glycosyltransferase involved in cell wall biosynthesis
VLDARVLSGSGGGPDKTILNSPRFLESAGYRNLCLYMHGPDDAGFEQIRSRARALDAPLVSVHDEGPLDWKVLPRSLNICRREKVAVWHGHDYKSNLLGLLLSRFWPMRLVTTVHGWVHQTRRTPLYYQLDRLCLPHYERIVCVSEDLQDECLRTGVPTERCHLIENAIDAEDYRRTLSAADAKRRLGLDPWRFLVGAVGRLSAEKGFDLLIEAVDYLLKSGLELDLLIVGEGDDRPRLERSIALLGRQQQVRLAGFRADTKICYQAMDIFALSSLREGLPNVLLEAMAMGVPVVATRIAGVPRLVEHARSGLLVSPGDSTALADAITEFMRDGELRNKLAGAARDRIENCYSFRARMDRLRELYDDLLATR